MRLTPAAEELLSHAINPLPLTLEYFRPQIMLSVPDFDFEPYARKLFPEARDATAALVGLSLQLANWSYAHEIAQAVGSREGSYWHAIIHRMEPDYSNANYWFRRVGTHPIFEEIKVGAQAILSQNPVAGWHISTSWVPETFCEWVREAIESKQTSKDTIVRAIQQLEVRSLFEYCASPGASR